MFDVIAKSMAPTILLVATWLNSPAELSADQQLVLACHGLDVQSVTKLLRDGADVNARFGNGDRSLFKDKWTFGTPMASRKWTPLIALAHARPYPDPPREIKNNTEDRDWAVRQLSAIPKTKFDARIQRQIAILHILLSHNCDLDVDDGYGATALYAAIYAKRERFVLTLLSFKPKVNTKTGIYIDGTGDITPLHRAAWSIKITKRLLAMGANAESKDSAGHTPLDWAKRYNSKVAAVYGSR